MSIISDNDEIPKVLAGSSHGNDNPDGSTGVPLGLGLGGLQAKVTCFLFFLSALVVHVGNYI